MNTRQRNWHLWAGFMTCLVAFASYPFFFVKFPVTRDVPWLNFLLFGAGVALLFFGLRRAFLKPLECRGKILGPVLSILSLFALGFFCYLIFHLGRQLPASAGAPRVGQKAAEFVLTDTNNQPVSLSGLISTLHANSPAPPKGVLLVFYRGYW